jgi:hypothetical protein
VCYRHSWPQVAFDIILMSIWYSSYRFDIHVMLSTYNWHDFFRHFKYDTYLTYFWYCIMRYKISDILMMWGFMSINWYHTPHVHTMWNWHPLLWHLFDIHEVRVKIISNIGYHFLNVIIWHAIHILILVYFENL